MKNTIFVAVVLAIGCTSQKNTTTATTDSLAPSSISQSEAKPASPSKNIILNNPGLTVNSTLQPTKSNATAASDKKKSEAEPISRSPKCLQHLIKKFMNEDVQNPPRKIFSYSYKNETVYYVSAPCCDFFSDLYDSKCRLIGHPDGGYTGKGDGTLKDFIQLRKNEKLVWEDTRKYK